MNQQEELILEILSSVDIIKGKTKFVKILHLVCKLLEKNKEESPFRFENKDYGIYTNQLEPTLQKLQQAGQIQIQEDSFSNRQELSIINRNYNIRNNAHFEISKEIKTLVQYLNSYSSDGVIAISYHLFPETTSESKIKPRIDNKIMELFNPLTPEFGGKEENVQEKEGLNKFRNLYPQFNDLDSRVRIMKSIGLDELPPITPSVIDESTGLLAKKHPFFKKYNLEEMLENARRG